MGIGPDVRTESASKSSGNGASTVAIVVGGRFHAFAVARELQRRDRLAAIISAYPRAHRELIRRQNLIWNPLLAVRERLELRFRPMNDAAFHAAVRFGRWAARRTTSAEIVQGWTGYSLETFRALRDTGTTRIARRGSAHIMTQDALLREEFARFGLTAEPVAPAMIDREMAEYAEADYVNVLSTFARNSFIAQGYPADRLIVTPLAAEVDTSVRIARRPRQAGAPLRALFLGSVSLQKGVSYLLQAVARLGGQVELSLIGGLAPEGPEILRRHATGRERRGKVARAELPELFAAHDVLVLPSVQDGFGAVISEAMAAGLPVIASTHTGGPDIVRHGKTGYLIAPRDIDGLAEALELLASDSDRCRAMGEAAARAIRSYSTWPDFVDDMMAQYECAHALRQ